MIQIWAPYGKRIASFEVSPNELYVVAPSFVTEDVFLTYIPTRGSITINETEVSSDVAINPASDRIVLSQYEDGRLSVWNITDHSSDTLEGQYRSGFSSLIWNPPMEFVPGTNLLILGERWDDALVVWDLDSGTQVTKLYGHGDTISTIQMSPDGRFIISSGQDATVRLWGIPIKDD